MEAVYAADAALLVWWATDVECASAIARLERDGELDVQAVGSAFERLDSLSRTWHEIHPVEQLRRTARRLLRVHSLRAADSLQLAAALLGAEQHAGSLEFVSLDRRLGEAARREGFAVLDVASPTDDG